MRRVCGIISTLVLFSSISMASNAAVAQSQPNDCKNSKTGCATLGPSKATPELNSPNLPPTGNGKDAPTLPKGRTPIGEDIKYKLERRNAIRELQPEAAYRLSVEIGRHFGLSLDGKESYEEIDKRIQQEIARREREQLQQRSSYATCNIPGSDQSMREGSITCLESFSPALCPGCRSGWTHRCERANIGGQVHGAWRPLEDCKKKSPPATVTRNPTSNASNSRQTSLSSQGHEKQSDCEFLLENIAEIGKSLDSNNSDSKYNEMMRICGGDINVCMTKIQACASD